MATPVGLRDVQGQLLSAIKSMAARSEAYAKDRDADRARIYAEATRQLAESWAALARS